MRKIRIELSDSQTIQLMLLHRSQKVNVIKFINECLQQGLINTVYDYNLIKVCLNEELDYIAHSSKLGSISIRIPEDYMKQLTKNIRPLHLRKASVLQHFIQMGIDKALSIKEDGTSIS